METHDLRCILQMNDPIHVEVQADDMWYEGLNMRTGEKGIVPYYYLQSVADDLDDMSGNIRAGKLHDFSRNY